MGIPFLPFVDDCDHDRNLFLVQTKEMVVMPIPRTWDFLIREHIARPGLLRMKYVIDPTQRKTVINLLPLNRCKKSKYSKIPYTN